MTVLIHFSSSVNNQCCLCDSR